MDDLLSEFIAETRETLEAIAGELVAWEADPADRGRLDAIFRFVHTVKGSCGFIDLPRLERLSHAAEDTLGELRAGTRQADRQLVSAVLAVIDRIGDLVDAIESGEPLPDSGEQALIAALARDAAPAADAPLPAVVPPAGGPRAVARSIRLPVELLDRMMAGVSDMVLARNELARLLREGDESAVDGAFERLSLCVGEMRDAITRSRMARIETLFTALPRLVRDLANELGRQVQLEIDGGDVELDREMIELIRDPLTHIARNALDHGIEPPAERRAVGKPETGQLRIGARQSGNHILIEVQDDGRGLDAERIATKAIEAGLVRPAEVAAMSRSEQLDLVFLPGLSTARSITAISGRGVGMDVVRANIERIGGQVAIDSTPGAGLRLTLRVPLTLTIIPALTVSAGGVAFAIPRAAIEEIVRLRGEAATAEAIGGGAMARIRGIHLPLVTLSGFLGVGQGDAPPPFVMVVRTGSGEHYALGVDAVHDHEELVVKPAAPALMASGIYAGTTLPDDSRPMLLLDVAGIAAAARIRPIPRELPAIVAANDARETVTALVFLDLDGAVRAVRLALIDRIDEFPASAAVVQGGRTLLAQADGLVALHVAAPVPAEGKFRVLRIGDGIARISYAAAEVIDVVSLPMDAAAPGCGPIEAVVMHEGHPVELLDAYRLFAAAEAAVPAPAAPPLCLLADADDVWAREMLAPLLAAAGYRVAFGSGAATGEVAVVVAGDAEPTGSAATHAPVVRLRATPERRSPEDASIYRYDRERLLAAVKQAAGR